MLGKKDSTKKTEHILQDGETIVLQELCYYYRDGALVTRKLGNVILTDKRFIILKSAFSKVSFAAIVVPIVIVVGVLIEMLPNNMGFLSKVLITAISGGIVGELSSVISKHLAKNKREINELPSGEIIALIDRGNIESAEKENKGVRKRLVVKLKDGTLHKISVKDKDGWRTELLKKM